MDIRDIAKLAKVSTATVSRALNGVPTVDPKLAKRVWEVAAQLGYVPNTHARSLVSGRSRTFGLVVSEITNPFFPEIVHTFETLAVESGYEVLLTSTVNDPRRMEIAVRRMIERRVDGVAILTFGMEETLLADLRQLKVPLVFVDVGPDVPGVTNIRVDYRNGIRQAVQHLAALRHQRIAFIAGPLQRKSAEARQSAFVASMQEIGLAVPPDYLMEGDHSVEGGAAGCAHLLALPVPPTAVICSNDMTAIGVMRRAYECGVSVPAQLSVVGFDDIRLARYMNPPLTTIQMSQTDLATMAFGALRIAMNHDREVRRGSDLDLSTSLVLRGSTAMAPEPVPSAAT